MSIICLGLNHKTAPVNVRERFSLIEAQLPAALQALCDQPGIDEALILSTCNRTEIYISSENSLLAMENLYSYLFLIHKIPAKQVEKYFYVLSETNAVKHLFTVASGLDSMIIGEGQILSQVKQAFNYAKHCNTMRDILNKLFLHAIKTGKRARTQTQICRGASSVSFAAVELIKKKFKNLSDLKVFVVGTGKMGYQAVDFLHKNGVKQIYLTNRSYDKALTISQNFNAVPVMFENLYEIIQQVDIVISSTASPHFVITKDRLQKAVSIANYRPLFIIDIAVPRDIDPDVKKIKNVTLYNIDDLGEIVNKTITLREGEIEKVKAIIEEETYELTQIINAKRVIPVIQAIQQRHNDIMEDLIMDLPEEEKEKFKKFGSKLIGRLLHQPMIKIKKLSNNEKFIKDADFIKQIFG